MSALLIVDIDVHDPQAYQEYIAAVPDIIQRHGGTYLVRGGSPETTEGEWQCARLVILEFPDRAAARAFLASEEYAPFMAIRHRVASSRGILVDGV